MNHFKVILEIGGRGISYEIALTVTWISLYLTDDKSTLVQVITWCPQAASHYLSKCRPRSMSTYGVTRPHWVNKFLLFSQHCFLSHFTPQYPQLTCISTQPLYSHQHICFLCHLLIFHNKKKHHLNLLSSLYSKSIADAHPSFLFQEAILFCLFLKMWCHHNNDFTLISMPPNKTIVHFWGNTLSRHVMLSPTSIISDMLVGRWHISTVASVCVTRKSR